MTFEAFDAVFQVAKLINDLYNADGTVNDNPIDGDTDPETWTASLPVYSEPGGPCNNEGPEKKEGGSLIIGFAKVVLRIVNTVPEKTLTATVTCDALAQPGGAPDFGRQSLFPMLVQ